jgi:hypothetical protein
MEFKIEPQTFWIFLGLSTTLVVILFFILISPQHNKKKTKLSGKFLFSIKNKKERQKVIVIHAITTKINPQIFPARKKALEWTKYQLEILRINFDLSIPKDEVFLETIVRNLFKKNFFRLQNQKS